MPGEDVIVSASFEDIPEEKIEEKPDILFLIIIAAAAFLVILVVVIIIVRYKTRPAVIEYDENGAIILDDDGDDGWIDESIVIEDGFANGKIVRENTDFEDNYETGIETDRLDD